METGDNTAPVDNGRKGSETGRSANPRFVYVLSIFATLGGFLFGYDTGIVSGSMLLIRPYFKLDTIWTEVIVSGTVASAAVFSVCGGYLADYVGRRRTIMAASVVFTMGAVVMGAAPDKEVLLVGRIIIGIGIGFASVTVPVYVAEVAPSNIRGTLVTLNQLFITIGILVSSIIAGAFSDLPDTGWRYMLGLAAVPGIVQFVGFLFLPESPHWMIDSGHVEKARKILMQVRGTPDVEEEMTAIKQKLEESKKASSFNNGFILTRVLTTSHVRRSLFVGAGLQFFQQVCGINTVIYYSATIMRMAGFTVQHAIWLVVAPNAVNFLATFIGMYLVDRLGRKVLLLCSFVGVFVSLGVLATGFQLSSINAPPINVTETFNNETYTGACNKLYSNCDECTTNTDCGFCYDVSTDGSCLPVDSNDEGRSLVGRCNASDEPGSAFTFAYGYCPNNYSWMPVFGMVLFVFSFAPGLGPIPWTVNSEIYPLWARGTCTALAGATNWTFNLLISLTFLTLTETITKYGTFWLYAGMCVVGFVFVLIFLPETKDKSLEEVEQLFMTSGSREEKIHFLHADALSKQYTPATADKETALGSDA
ncbi:proton myo-inositol cotransporter-like [Haliotis cracherodii]|uniref:proton myo-inositol cotransporter-like n=1 Tax=Haliotis cracherodii TaxID=6455 RepID=UPI0039E77F28